MSALGLSRHFLMSGFSFFSNDVPLAPESGHLTSCLDCSLRARTHAAQQIVIRSHDQSTPRCIKSAKPMVVRYLNEACGRVICVHCALKVTAKNDQLDLKWLHNRKVWAEEFGGAHEKPIFRQR